MPFRFANPELLWLLLVLPVLSLLHWHARRQRRRLWQRLGRPEMLARFSTVQRRRRSQSRYCFMMGTLTLILGLAGPRWGKGDAGIIIGRDLMIALDLSKSMMADDMRDAEGTGDKERWLAARRSIHELVASLRKKGGHRIGLVVFAAKPWVVCPLTADYDHFLLRLDEFTEPANRDVGPPLAPPPEVNPTPEEEFVSGTRIGTAIAEAVKWHDPRFKGFQDVLLISDGDDPSTIDRDAEIASGIKAAEEAKIPVHVVGVGDPDHAVLVTFKRSLTEEEILGPTKLNEEPLQEIARQTKGEYLAAGRDQPRLAEFFQTRIESNPSRELPDDALPQAKDRSVWFLLTSVVLLLWAWWLDR